jgi:alpha-glucosidase
MHLVLDVTLNHCGWKHPWFEAAQADAAAPTAEYFTFHRHPDHYESWLGHRSLPKLNYRSEKLRDVLFRAPDSVLRRWLKDPYCVDGWRFDVANMQGRQGALQLGHKIGRQIRRAVKADNPQAYLFGEHFHDATPNLQGDELDATMNYQGFAIPLWRWLAGADQGMFGWAPESADRTLLPAEYLAEQWTRYRAAVPWVITRQQYNLLGSHDTARILTMLGGAKVLVRLAAVMLFTYPGVPSIYYGDEIGMEGGSDPDNRRCMIWDESVWDHDLRRHFQKLAWLRRNDPALVRGGFQSLYARDGLLAFQRQSEEQRLVVIGYRGPDDLAEAAIPVRHGAIRDGARFEDLLNGGAYTVAGGALRLTNLVRGSALTLEQVEN